MLRRHIDASFTRFDVMRTTIWLDEPLLRVSGASSPTLRAFAPDAFLAALAIERGCEWITTDRDFARFRGLRWRHPLQSR